jgi:hypothetical protein
VIIIVPGIPRHKFCSFLSVPVLVGLVTLVSVGMVGSVGRVGGNSRVRSGTVGYCSWTFVEIEGIVRRKFYLSVIVINYLTHLLK